MPSNYGRFFGAIPMTAGRVFWVAPSASYQIGGHAYQASDSLCDGLTPEKALATINRAWQLVTADVGDVIVLLPGTHTPSASIAANVAGVTMTGLAAAGPLMRQRSTIAAVTGDETMNVTAADIELAYFNIIPVTAQEAIDFSSAAHGLHVHHVYFDLNTPAASTSTVGLAATGAATRVNVNHCVFDSDGAQGNAIDATATLDSVIEENLFTLSGGTWASVILVGAGTDRLLVRRNTVSCAGTAITVFVNGTGADQATGVLCHDNRCSSIVTVPFDNFDASECEIAQNFDAGVGAGDGGAILTAIT